ncbi:MAG TPA: ABC-2 family transporter protein [Acidimicrobiia bacterium]|nr:ABC-2 family transporter protein [Acidimicrobiia bacterium]
MSGLMHSLAITLVHWRLGAQYEVQYRLNFLLQLVESAVRLVTGLVAIQLVFGFTADLRGWGESELLAVLGVHILLGGILATFVLPNMFTFMHEVGEGELDFALVRPVDSQLFISTRQLRFWNLVDIVTGVLVLGWALSGLSDRLTAVQVLVFVFTMICGALVLYSVWMAFTTTAFWLIDVDEMAQLITGLYDAGRWPIRVYPVWLQGALTAVVPLGVAITVPAEALTGRLTLPSLAVLVVVTIVSVAASRAFWLHGVRNYSGASA